MSYVLLCTIYLCGSSAESVSYFLDDMHLLEIELLLQICI